MIQPPKVDRVMNRGHPKVPRKGDEPWSGSKGPILCRMRRIRMMATAPKRRIRDA